MASLPDIARSGPSSAQFATGLRSRRRDPVSAAVFACLTLGVGQPPPRPALAGLTLGVGQPPRPALAGQPNELDQLNGRQRYSCRAR